MNEKIEKLIPILAALVLELDKLNLREQDKEEAAAKGPLNPMIIDLITRYRDNINAISLILVANGSHSYVNIDHPVGLLLRSSLSDSLRSFHMVAFLDVESDGKQGYMNISRQKRLKVLVDKDQLPRHQKAILKLIEKSQGTGLEQTYRDYLPEFEKLFKQELDDALAEKGDLGSMQQMAIEVATSDRFNEDGYMLYNYWLTYSAYEHYGSITSKLNHNGKFEKPKIENMLRALAYCLQGLAYLFAVKSFDPFKDFVTNSQKQIGLLITGVEKSMQDETTRS